MRRVRKTVAALCAVAVLVMCGLTVVALAESKGYYKSGELKFEYNYVDGIRQGVSKEYYKNGKLRLKENYQKGKLEGICKEYYQNGELKSKSEYVSGKKQGIFKDYYKNGKLQSEEAVRMANWKGYLRNITRAEN